MTSFAVCLLPLLFLAAVVDGTSRDNGRETGTTLRHLKNRILDLIELQIEYYLNSNVESVDISLMLGVSIMKGKMFVVTS